MKNIFYTAIVLVLLLGCEKESLEIQVYYPGSMTYGKATAMKGNKLWVASGIAKYNSERPSEYFAINFGTFSEEGFFRESIYFTSIPIRLV